MNSLWSWTLILGCTSVALTGCLETADSDQVKTSAIYQAYNVSYSESDSTLDSTAQFLVGGPLGTTLELKSPSRVTFNGAEMSRQHLLGTRYIRHLPNRSFEAEHVWRWTDPDGKDHENKATIAPFHLEDAPTRFSISATYLFRISAQDLTSADRIQVNVTQAADGSSSTFFLNAVSRGGGSYQVSVDNGSSVRLRPGPARMQISRTRSAGVQDGTPEGGSISATYETAPVEVNVVE